MCNLPMRSWNQTKTNQTNQMFEVDILCPAEALPNFEIILSQILNQIWNRRVKIDEYITDPYFPGRCRPN